MKDVVESELVMQMRSTLPQLIETANTCEVWDHDSYNQAADLAKFISEAVKTIESERKRITQPLNESLKATNKLFANLSSPLEAALAVTKGKILKYKLEEDRRAREELERKKAEALAAEAEAIRNNEPVPLEVVANLDAMAPVPTTAARGGFGSVSTQKRWTFRVTDKLAVPPVYLLVDEKRVNQAIRDGMREIPGLEIYQEEIAVVR